MKKSKKIILQWPEYLKLVNDICVWAKTKNFDAVYGVARGGLIPSVMISHQLDIKYVDDEYLNVYHLSDKKILVVEDAIDTGNSVKEFVHNPKYESIVTISKHVDCPFEPDFYPMVHDRWLVFPYEKGDQL